MYKIIISILIIGTLLFLAFIHFTNPLGVNKKANKWLALFILTWSSYWIQDLPPLVPYFSEDSFILVALKFIQFIGPVFLYLSVIFFTNPEYKLKRRNGLLLILPITYLIILIIFYLDPSLITNTDRVEMIGLLLLHSLLLLGLALLELKQYRKKIPLFSSTINDINLNWLNSVIIALLVIHISVTIYNIVYYPKSLNLLVSIWIFIITYFTGYHSLKQKEIYPNNKQERNELLSIAVDTGQLETKKKLIDDEELIHQKNRLTIIMNEQEPYLDNTINLSKLAEISQLTPHQLSFVINNGFKENFFQFINKYRIDKAKGYLISKENANLNMLGIAFESGFNSKTSFNTTFKKIVGLTPSEFKKNTLKLKKCSDL